MTETQATPSVPLPTPDVVIPGYLQTLLEQIATREGFADFNIISESGSNIGDGFQGLMLSVVIVGTRHTKVDEKLVLICKIPPLSDLRRQMCVVPFMKEIYLYDEILPEIVQFQRENGVAENEGFFSFPKCYGTFANQATMEFAIVLQDLRSSGYRMWNKFQSIDYSHVQMAVTELGKLHAVSFALRKLKPEVFEKFTKVESTIFKTINEFGPGREMMNKSFERAIETLREEDVEERKKIGHLKDNFVDIMETISSGSAPEPHTVLCHGDFWNNNMMFEYASTDSLIPLRVCLIDWQLSQYCSPATDLCYYIYSATEQTLRSEHFDDILRAYYDNLAKLLKRLGGNAAEQFTPDDFQGQLRRFGLYAMAMAPLLVQVVTVKPEDIPDMDSLTLENAEDFDFMSNGKAEGYDVRLSDVIRDFVGRGYFGDEHLAGGKK